MKRSDIPMMNLLINSLEQTEAKLEASYRVGDAVGFINTKKFMKEIQNKISRIVG